MSVGLGVANTFCQDVQWRNDANVYRSPESEVDIGTVVEQMVI
jgi:hypothetical protein